MESTAGDGAGEREGCRSCGMILKEGRGGERREIMRDDSEDG